MLCGKTITMNFPRASGILLHPTSLPGDFGIGDVGPKAYEFVDLLAEAKQTYWQILPLGPTGYGDSPYQCFSAFAGNPYLIDPEALVRARLLSTEDLGSLCALDGHRVDFGGLYRLKRPILFTAYEAWRRNPDQPLPYGDFREFQRRHASWLSGYSLFSALKDHFGG